MIDDGNKNKHVFFPVIKVEKAQHEPGFGVALRVVMIIWFSVTTTTMQKFKHGQPL